MTDRHQALSPLQLDALQELANIGCGHAATALSAFVGREVEVSVPAALALPLADAVETFGDPASSVVAVALPVVGDLEAVVLLLVSPASADALCQLLGVAPGSELGRSALSEVGNILASSYVSALATITGRKLEPRPPQTVEDMLGAVAASILAPYAEGGDLAFLLDSRLALNGHACDVSVVLVPSRGGLASLLGGLGLAG